MPLFMVLVFRKNLLRIGHGPWVGVFYIGNGSNGNAPPETASSFSCFLGSRYKIPCFFDLKFCFELVYP